MRITLIVLWSSLLILLGVPAQAQDLELVESWPAETDFDQPDIRDAKEVWLEMIGQARSEILWQTFYLAHEKGRATDPVLQALKAAAGRGVDVKILADEKFTATYPETLAELDALDGIEVRSSKVGAWFGGVMHAKAIFVDGEQGFVGSQNFDWRSLEHIRELGVHFRSKGLTRPYVTAFMWEWENCADLTTPSTLADVHSDVIEVDGSHLLPTFSPNALNVTTAAGDEAEILKLLDEAKESIEIAVLVYSPLDHHGSHLDPAIDNALRRAAVRGVKVRLMMGHWVEGKKGEDHLRSLDALDNVELRCVRIPPAAEGEIPFARVHHSKYLVCDDRKAWLGTSNWQPDYFHASRNYGLVMLDGPLPARLRKLYDFDWERSTGLQLKASRP